MRRQCRPETFGEILASEGVSDAIVKKKPMNNKGRGWSPTHFVAGNGGIQGAHDEHRIRIAQ